MSSSGSGYVRIDRFLVPLDSPAAIRYFERNLRVSHGIRERLGIRTRRIGSEGSIPRIPDEALRASGVGRDVRPLFVVDYETNGRGRTVAFLFAPRGDLPVAVVKLRPASGGGLPLRRELEALERVGAVPSPALRDSIPRPIAFIEEAGDETLVLSPLDGRAAYLDLQNSLWPSRHIERHFSAAGQWLAAFHRETGSGREASRHGDFWARNVLLGRDGRARVVDWEHFTARAEIFYDLFHFPLTYGLNFPWKRYRRATPIQAFSATFLERTAVAVAVERYLRAYAGATGNSVVDLARCFPIFLENAGTPPGSEAAGLLKGALPWREFMNLHARSSRFVFCG